MEALQGTVDRGEPPVKTAHSALQRALMSSGGRSLGNHWNSKISSDGRWLVAPH